MLGTGGVEVLVFSSVEEGFFDVFLGAEADIPDVAGVEAFELGLVDGAAFAELDMLEVHDRV